MVNLLPRAVFMDHDNTGHTALKQKAALKGLSCPYGSSWTSVGLIKNKN